MTARAPWVLVLSHLERGPNYGYLEKLLGVTVRIVGSTEAARQALGDEPRVVLVDGSFQGIEEIAISADCERLLTVDIPPRPFCFLVNFLDVFDDVLGGRRFGELEVIEKTKPFEVKKFVDTLLH